MQIGFVGLGRMGGNMVLRLIERGGHDVVAFDIDSAAVAGVTQAGAAGVVTLEQLVAGVEAPRAIFVMVPSGEMLDRTIYVLGELCAPGDVIADGGNTHYKDSMRRAEQLARKGVELLDVGTSGGIWGRELGYSLMVGGSAHAFARIEPVLRTLAPEGGCAHVGPSGAGHYCKMVHNGVEYALMQSYGEGFSLLKHGPFDYELGRIAELWNHGGVIRSWLLELVADVLHDDPGLAEIRGYVEDTGEGRWTVEAAVEHAIPAPVITQALYARFRSREDEDFGDKLVAALRKQFGGHSVRRPGS